jgi:hypothetical protein
MKGSYGLRAGTLLATLRDMSENATANEIDHINELADELNDEARDVLEYQVSLEAAKLDSCSF